MSAHVASKTLYVTVFAALIALTALTVAAAYTDLGALNTPVALTIAVLKALLVILFFMHVKDGPRLTWVVVASGFFWLGIMIALTLSDYLSRGWLPMPGR